MEFPIFPTSASSTAHQTDFLYFALVALTAFFMLIIFAPMLYWIFKYRRGRKVDRRMPKVPSAAIEITWTVLPLAIAMGLFVWSSRVYFDIQRPPAAGMEIMVVGKQWMWKIQHPEGNSEINQLHVPVDRTVKIVLTSQDVIHNFYLPAFRVKKDAIPGRYTTEWFHATKPGVYHIFCGEYCGMDHAKMVGSVVVMKAAEYQDWLTTAAPGETLAERGGRLFRDLGCSGCHLGSSVARAPRLQGVYGKPVPLQSGEVVMADDKYIRDSIIFPQLQIAASYEPIMPTFDGYLGEDELLQLVAYIRSLGNQALEGNSITNGASAAIP